MYEGDGDVLRDLGARPTAKTGVRWTALCPGIR
jgi:hypothetical protein